MKKIINGLLLTMLIMLISLYSNGQGFPVTVTDQTASAPLSNPTPSSYQPRYISGFGEDDSFTIFYEDRDNSSTISYVQTTSGPTGFPSSGTATNISETHFCVKDWPINIDGTDYDYRAWGSVGNNMDHKFYVSNDLANWTLVSTFTISNASGFSGARGWVYYGFHDVILINGTYYAFAESNQGQTMLCKSTNGDDSWEAFASVGGTQSADGPLQIPSGVSFGWTPSGTFFDLGNDNGYGKIYCDPRDSDFYLAINTEAKASLSPSAFESAFTDPDNWTWNDGSIGPAANAIISETTEHDLRECWQVPTTTPADGWTVIYDADFGSGDGGKALGYLTMSPPVPITEVWVDDDYCESCGNDGHTWGTDAFDNIQDGIDGVEEEGTVNVAAGTYMENVSIFKELTLNGAQADVVPITGGRSGGESTIQCDYDLSPHALVIKADNVTVNGFEFVDTYTAIDVRTDVDVTRQNVSLKYNYINSDAAWVGVGIGQDLDAGPKSTGEGFFDNIAVDNSLFEVSADNNTHNSYVNAAINLTSGFSDFVTYSNLSITNNDISNNGSKGVFAGANPNDFLVDGVTISNNNVHDCATGLNIYNLKDLTFSGNTIEDIEYAGAQINIRTGTVSNNTFQNIGPSPYWPYSGSYYPSTALILWGTSYGPVGSHDATIENNEFHFNNFDPEDEYAARVLTGCDASSISFTSNKFYNGGATVSAKALKNYESDLIDASNNYWGSAAPNFGALLEGPIDFCPWYTDEAMNTLSYPVHNTTQSTDHCSIQDAIDNAAAGDVISVDAGVYYEEVLISGLDNITLQGAGENNTIIAPYREYTSSNYGITIDNANGVTITNLKIDGFGNASLTEDVAHYKDGIHWSENGGSNCTITNVTVNNVDRRGISVWPENMVNNQITYCTVDNVTAVNFGYGHGIKLNGSGIVENCTISNVTAGLMGVCKDQTGSLSIQNNTITDLTGETVTPFDIGINFWCYYSNDILVKDNVITAEVEDNTGIYVVRGGDGSEISGNTITLTGNGGVGIETGWEYDWGFPIEDNTITMGKGGAGILVTGSGTESDPMLIQNNTLSNSGSDDIFTNNYAGYNKREVGLLLSGNKFTSRTGDAHYPFYGSISGNEIDGFKDGIVLVSDPYDASGFNIVDIISCDQNIIKNHDTAAARYGFIYDDDPGDEYDFVFEVIGEENTDYQEQDLSYCYWGSATPDFNEIIDGKIEYCPFYTDEDLTETSCPGVTNTTQGKVYCTIQGAIDEANNNDVINVAAGTYNEDLDINKPLELYGAGATQTKIIISDKIEATGLNGSLTFEGFEVEKPGEDSYTGTSFILIGYGIEDEQITITNNKFTKGRLYLDHLKQNVQISNNTFNNSSIGWDRHLGEIEIANNTINVYENGIGIFTWAWYIDGQQPTDNFDNLHWIHNNEINTNDGCGILYLSCRDRSGLSWPNKAKFTNLTIENNTITNVGDGWRDAGIALQRIAGQGPGGWDYTTLEDNVGFEDAEITNNTLTPYSGTAVTPNGIVLAGSESTSVTDNSIDGFNNGIDLTGLVVNTVINENSITNNTLNVVNNNTEISINATCNWWGSTDPYDVANLISGDVQFLPFWTSATGPCDGVGPVQNTTQGTSYMTIQGAVDDAESGDVIQVSTGTYNENITVAHMGIELQGAGVGQTIIDGSGLSSPTVYFVETDDVDNDMWIHGFSFINSPAICIDANMVHNTGTVKVTNNEFDGNSSYAFYAHTSYPTCNIIVNSNTFNSATTTRILLERVEGSVEIGNNTFNNCISYAIYSASYSNTNGNHNVTGKHWFHGNDITGDAGKGIVVESAASWGSSDGGTYSNVEISNNNIEDIREGYNGISLYVSGTNGGINNAEISNNTISSTITSNENAGIKIDGPCNGTTVSDNSIDNFGTGILLEGQEIASVEQYPVNSLINENQITNSNLLGLNYEGTEETLDATENYWGTCPSYEGDVSIYPYYSDAAMTNSITNIQASDDETICSGSSTTISASNGSNFLWDNGLGLGASKVVSPTATTTYTVTGNDLNGCATDNTKDSVTITVIEAPVVLINDEDDGSETIASGSSITLTASGASTYAWNTGATTAEINVSPTSTTVYSVTGTSDGGCTDETTFTVNVASVDAGPNQFICEGETATLTATTEGFTGTTFVWNPGGLDGQSVDVTPATTTEYTVTVNNTYTDNVTVYVNPKPVADAGDDITIASGGSGTLYGSASGGTSPYSYSWTGPESFTSSDQNPVVSDAGTYYLEVTDGFGCVSDQDDVLVSVSASGVSVSGNVSYAFCTINEQMHEVEITLTNGGTSYSGTTASTGDGDYEILGVEDGTYTVSLNSPKPWGGVNSADLIAVVYHYYATLYPGFGFPQIPESIKRTAGDVDNDGDVDMSDYSAIASRIGGTSYTSGVGDWVFMTDGLYSTATVPYANNGGNSTNQIQLTVSGSDVELDFKGLCYGDVNASYTGMKDDEIFDESMLVDLTKKFGLMLKNFPNPFNHNTTITYLLPVDSKVTLEVYDLMGNKVDNILDNVQQPLGLQNIEYRNKKLNPGVYILILNTHSAENVNFRQTGKWIITQ